YGTEASVNLSDDGELVDLMVRANFNWVFLGIESPSAESLKETRKFQNLTGDGRGHDRTIASGYTNILTLIPEMRLLEGHGQILQSIYAPEAYFKRAFEALCHLPHPGSVRERIARALWLWCGFRMVDAAAAV
ncbi:MAG: DUF4070 domain-containing protein, partial [Gammaproteobacteria bacterium]|nr:DUF4070 domain-containing protein [Gammaproteobacteria bacterium]